jgi:hypothetical protein
MNKLPMYAGPQTQVGSIAVSFIGWFEPNKRDRLGSRANNAGKDRDSAGVTQGKEFSTLFWTLSSPSFFIILSN